MRILIVDENTDFCVVLREYLREGLAGAAAHAGARPAPLAVKEWRPVAQGVPTDGAKGFRWNFDALLVNCQADADATFKWINAARISAGAAWPPALLLVGGKDAKTIASHALDLGIAECVPRLQLTPQRLYEALIRVVETSTATTVKLPPGAARAADETPPPAAADESAPAKTPVAAEKPAAVEKPSAVEKPAAVEKSAAPKAASPGADASRSNAGAAKPARKAKAGALPDVRGYRIDRMIGEGGTSRVYLANRESDDLQVVLKLLLPELASDSAVVTRFMQEFSLIQKIKSAHVTRIFDLNYDDGNAYLAMEYFGAGDLRERIVQGGMPPVAALKIFAQVARALGAIHDAGVVHRDLKPHNIMFRDQKHLAIVDFGGAKALGETTSLTKVGHIIGTPNYMSPEQITGEMVDLRTDIYSLGVILHLLLTGRTLFTASSHTDLMDMHLNAPIPRLPEELNGFQKLLNKLVAKKPENRFQSARELYAYIAY